MSDAWAEQMRAAAGLAEPEEPPAPPIQADWRRVPTAEGGYLDVQILPGSHGLRGRRLLVVELGEDAESRVPEAIAALAG